MKKVNLSVLLILFSVLAGNIFAQDINDANYHFKLKLPTGWNKTKSEETSKHDAVSYSFDRSDRKNALMILGFKVPDVKNLDDFIYTLEKDMTLNIPSRNGEYKDFDEGDYDGKNAVYKDTEFTENIYFIRTKFSNSADNYAYMIRFITPSSYYNSSTESEIQKIIKSFSISH
jgi:hypothetical protein